MAATDPQSTLEHWHRELAEHQMPVFAHTARAILGCATDEATSATELSRLILQDVSMTARVLRMANSSYFNPGGGKVTTVSRAIVLLGFDVARDICLSISLIDTFLRGPHRGVVVAEMAQSFHAAMQARSLAELGGQKEPEEVFIATLLYRLGILAFWCFAGSIDDAAAARLRKAVVPGADSEEVEGEVLGFRLRDLTGLLNQSWGLSPLLSYALDARATPSARVRTIGLGHRIARVLREGQDEGALARVMAEAERALDLPACLLRERALASARRAADIIAVLGAPEAAAMIAGEAVATDRAGTASIGASAPVPQAAAREGTHEPDPGLQLEILRELAQLMEEPRPNVNLMLEMVLEGIYRGVGMDRAVLALLTPDRASVRAKHVLGDQRERVQEAFRFRVLPPHANAIAWVIAGGQPLWLGRPAAAEAEFAPDTALEELSGGQCFLMPLAVGGKPVGCLYADRRSSGRRLDEELFAQFRLFGQQARMGLSYLKA